MKHYEPRIFDLPEIHGISKRTIETHLKLYEGYVKHAQLLLERLHGFTNEPENHGEILAFQRRFSFEFDGMRNHEYYFGSLEGGPRALTTDAVLQKAAEEEWGSFENWLERFKVIATTRGVGWAMLYYDSTTERLLHTWVDEQHLGHLIGLTPLVALDMWEHSYILDYTPANKGAYVDAYLAAVNWETINKRLSAVQESRYDRS